jgi:hypothetical protein
MGGWCSNSGNACVVALQFLVVLGQAKQVKQLQLCEGLEMHLAKRWLCTFSYSRSHFSQTFS